MTSKEAAKEILKTHCSSCYTRGCKTCAYNTALLAMLHPSDNWTPCSVELPKSAEDVDVSLSATDGWGEDTAIGRYYRGNWLVYGMDGREVVAWRDRPEPYRAGV